MILKLLVVQLLFGSFSSYAPQKKDTPFIAKKAIGSVSSWDQPGISYKNLRSDGNGNMLFQHSNDSCGYFDKHGNENSISFETYENMLSGNTVKAPTEIDSIDTESISVEKHIEKFTSECAKIGIKINRLSKDDMRYSTNIEEEIQLNERLKIFKKEIESAGIRVKKETELSNEQNVISSISAGSKILIIKDCEQLNIIVDNSHKKNK